MLAGFVLATWFGFQSASATNTIDQLTLRLPKVGDHALRVLTPTLLELVRINTKQPDPADLDSWDWVNEGNFAPPSLSSIRVIVNGQTNNVTGVGFRRRPLYAPLEVYDLRIGNYLYLQLSNPIVGIKSVNVINNGTLWPTNMEFKASTDSLRYNPAIHVNQEGYIPAFPKKAMVGYYLGNFGEMVVPTNTFFLVNVQSGALAYQGTMTARPDVGYIYTPTPYQQVREADFSSFTTPGEYRLMVPGMGASLPFRISDGVGMAFARTYALGLFHQRSGFNVAMPFTRFTHAADHTAPASVPTNATSPTPFTWIAISNYASYTSPENPTQTAPLMTNPAAQLYPYIRQGPVDVSGGHFEAGNYSRVTWNMAQMVHVLMYAVDSLPGVAALDNLGIPESGDGISDALQEAKWEADCIAKMQDTDGGFYYMIYPQDREYEFDVLPEHGDPEVVWPKNTATTAAAVAALAQCASSPRFKQAYPQVASNYWFKARLGWTFLTNAIATNGLAGSYQKIMHFDDDFTHMDDLAWAACEMFLATGNAQFHSRLLSWFPDPLDLSTIHWGWQRMFESYGNAIRGYAAAVKSGRLQPNQLDANYLSKCNTAITDAGNDYLLWSQDTAYGTSLNETSKRIRSVGWYFSSEHAFDLVVAYQSNPNPAYLNAILGNLNYEGGCNPVNMTFVTGLGWKRQRTLVDLYSYIDGRALPKTGIPIGCLQEGFIPTWTYGSELSALCFPSEFVDDAPYPFYDRWGDAWTVSTEASTDNTVKSFAVAAWLAGQTSLTNQAWRSTNASIVTPPGSQPPGAPVTVTLQVADPNLTGAKIVWEGRDVEPDFGGVNFTFTALAQEGPQWIEAEVQWPDGRRAFARNSITVSASAPPVMSHGRRNSNGTFSFRLTGGAQATYFVRASTDMVSWTTIATNVLPASGAMEITDSQANAFARRYYRAVKAP